MEIKQLYYIYMVAEHKSITKAAKHLFISQPSLSHYISKLEEDLQTKLFDRSTNPISLTYAGEKYVQTAARMLDMHSSLLKEMSDISQNKKGRIKIGMPRERATYMLPLIISDFNAQFPETKVKVKEDSTERLVEHLQKGTVDCIIVPKTEDRPELEHMFLYREHLKLIISHELARQYAIGGDPVDLSTLKQVPFIQRNDGQGIRQIVDRLIEKYGIALNVAMQTGSNMTAYRLATAGIGATIIPDMTLKLVNCVQQAHHFAIDDPGAAFDVVAMWRKDAYLSIPERAFLDIAAKVFHR